MRLESLFARPLRKRGDLPSEAVGVQLAHGVVEQGLDHGIVELGIDQFCRDPRQSFLVMSEVVGHLDLLVADGTCVWERDGAVDRVRMVRDVDL